MGRTPQTVTKRFSRQGQDDLEVTVELFTWEKTDRVADIRRAFGLS